MADEKSSTEDLIERVHLDRKKKSILINPQYLDDENLSEDEKVCVLKEIFNRNIREKQLKRIISHVSPVLDNAHPHAALVYGPTGSGKTVTLIHLLSKFKQVTQKHHIAFDYSYIDLTSQKTHFGALNEIAISLEASSRRYTKGIPVEYMQHQIIQKLRQKQGYLVFLIDEIDNILPNPNQFLTFLVKTLPSKVSCWFILIMLTNKLDWDKSLDPRLLSCLKKTDIIFEPYDAMDLLEIISLRANKALRMDKVHITALKKIAARASMETGDARKAVELLTKSVHIAEETSGQLTEIEVDLAEKRLEVDKSAELINALANHQKLALIACYSLLEKVSNKVSTGQAYELYQKICQKQFHRSLSQRRFCDIISYLDLYGLINARVVSLGRYGKTREIFKSLPDKVIKQLLSD